MVLKGCDNEGVLKSGLMWECVSCLIRNNAKSPSVHVAYLHLLVYEYEEG